MQQAVLSFADLIVRSPLVRWTWSGLADQNFPESLGEYRPSDHETVREMMAGRYLLASKLVDTKGVSPFAIEIVGGNWRRDLHAFSWLRHFRDARDDAERRFARTLVLDWIGRNSRFDPQSWAPALTSVRVLNWLRHLPLLTEGSNSDQARLIKRSLGTQLQSLKLRGALARDPMDAIYTAIALLGASLCDESASKNVSLRLARLLELLDAQIDADGLHRSRNARVQFELLTELVSIRKALAQRHSESLDAFGATMEKMHLALDTLTLGTGEPAYFNGCGQLPVDLVIAVQSQGSSRRKNSTVLSGYGVLRSGSSTIIGDSGVVPPPGFSANAHAGALAFEFSNGNDLVIGNCGPAPKEVTENRTLFRLGAAHSGPTIDRMSSAQIVLRGPNAGSLRGFADKCAAQVDDAEATMILSSSAFSARFGIDLERQLTLIAEGQTLVGQDRFVGKPGVSAKGKLVLRFHLAPGAETTRTENEDVILIKLKSGVVWKFLWEGGVASLDDSVRQSAHFGFFRTTQIVVEADIVAGEEVSWILTRDDG